MGGNLLLVGRTGNGKSSTGNSILNREAFKPMPATKTAEREIAVSENGNIKVVDGPGIGDADLNYSDGMMETLKDVERALSLCPEGFDAVLFTLKFGERFTTQEKNAVKMLKGIFGAEIIKTHGIVILTYGGNFDPDEDPEITTFEEWCRKQIGDVKQLFEECQYRVVLFNNKLKNEEALYDQRELLVDQVKKLQSSSSRYTLQEYDQAQPHRKALLVHSRLPELENQTQNIVKKITAEREWLDSSGSQNPEEYSNLRKQLEHHRQYIEDETAGGDCGKTILTPVDVLDTGLRTKIELIKMEQELQNSRKTKSDKTTNGSATTRPYDYQRENRDTATTPYDYQRENRDTATTPYDYQRENRDTATTPYDYQRQNRDTATTPYDYQRENRDTATTPYDYQRQNRDTATTPYDYQRQNRDTATTPYEYQRQNRDTATRSNEDQKEKKNTTIVHLKNQGEETYSVRSQPVMGGNLLLVGRTGNGKSSTGNSILNREAFKPMPATKTAEREIAVSENGNIKVVDGPGIGDADLNYSDGMMETLKDVERALSLCPEGFDAVLFTLKFGERFTTQEKNAVKMLKGIFGAEIIKTHGIVILTYGGNFDPDEDPEIKTFGEWCRKQTGDVKQLFEECQYRVALFNNKPENKEALYEQRELLMDQVKKLQSSSSRYTLQEYNQAQPHRKALLVHSRLPELENQTQNIVKKITAEREWLDSSGSQNSEEYSNLRKQLEHHRRYIEDETAGGDCGKTILTPVDVLDTGLRTKIELIKMEQELQNSRMTKSNKTKNRSATTRPYEDQREKRDTATRPYEDQRENRDTATRPYGERENRDTATRPYEDQRENRDTATRPYGGQKDKKNTTTGQLQNQREVSDAITSQPVREVVGKQSGPRRDASPRKTEKPWYTKLWNRIYVCGKREE